LKRVVPVIFILFSVLHGEDFLFQVEKLTSGIKAPRDQGDNSLSQISSPFVASQHGEDNVLSANGKCIIFDYQNAQREQFLKISGVDRYTAKVIVNYRTRNGFKSIDDIRTIPSVTHEQYSLIKRYYMLGVECEREQREKREKDIKKSSSGTSKSQKRRTLSLQMIINNRVKISNRWYSKGDLVSGYRVSKIFFDQVVLEKGKTQKILKLFSEKPSFHIELVNQKN
jgi:hypothetical protein